MPVIASRAAGGKATIQLVQTQRGGMRRWIVYRVDGSVHSEISQHSSYKEGFEAMKAEAAVSRRRAKSADQGGE